MEAGYQRELTYKRSDNSFSAFGNSDDHGSTWLTAFVVRSFKQAQSHIFIDQDVLDRSIDYLNVRKTSLKVSLNVYFLLQRQQRDTGEYAEQGHVHHKDMQGGASQGGVPMTSYVTLAILENGKDATKAVQYLESE